MPVMLATDICRTILRERPAGLLGELQKQSTASNPVLMSAITYAELVAAALLTEKQQFHMELIREFCDRLDDIVPWDTGAVDAYTTIQIQAMQGGYTVNMNDAMVAAHALSLNAFLLTGSHNPFDKVQALQVSVWEEEI